MGDFPAMFDCRRVNWGITIEYLNHPESKSPTLTLRKQKPLDVASLAQVWFDRPISIPLIVLGFPETLRWRSTVTSFRHLSTEDETFDFYFVGLEAGRVSLDGSGRPVGPRMAEGNFGWPVDHHFSGPMTGGPHPAGESLHPTSDFSVQNHQMADISAVFNKPYWLIFEGDLYPIYNKIYRGLS